MVVGSIVIVANPDVRVRTDHATTKKMGFGDNDQLIRISGDIMG